MDDVPALESLPDDPATLKAIIASRDQLIALHRATIATLTRQRDEFHLENLRLEVRLARALKQAYGPRADRIPDQAQLLLDFARQLEATPVDPADLPPAADDDAKEPANEQPAQPATGPKATRRIRARGRRDIGAMDHLPMLEKTYELTGDLCLCPVCQAQRHKIGAQISYTIEHVPASLLRIKHIQCKYACPHCDHQGDNPNIESAPKPSEASPIDKGMAGPGLLAHIATSKYADFLPLYRLEGIFARQGFELDRATMCVWMADVARIVRPVYDLMIRRVLLSHVIATDDTVMPLLQPGKARQARMWVYRGDELHPYNVFDFTISRSRDGPGRFLGDYRQILLADGYGGYDGVVLDNQLPRAGCWSHARRKVIDAQATAPDPARRILEPIGRLFGIEARARDQSPEQRLALRQARSLPALDALRGLLLEQKATLLPRHPLAQAISYMLNQWAELTLFAGDPAVPIHNNLAEQEMKRIALLRKNALFVATERGGQTAAILSSITSTCRRHGIDPQRYFTQLLTNLLDTPVSRLDQWLPDVWKSAQSPA
jgi:transposase